MTIAAFHRADILDASLQGVDAGGRVRTRRAMGTSVAVHVLLVSWLLILPQVAPETLLVTEITFLQPGELAAAGNLAGGAPVAEPSLSAPAAPARREAAATGPDRSGVAVTHPTEARFQRQAADAPLSPQPQSEDVVADRLTARLAALQRNAAEPAKWGAVALGPTTMWSSATAPTAGTGAGSGGKAPIELNRGSGGGGGRGGAIGVGAGAASGPGIALTRGGGGGGGAALAVPVLPGAQVAAAKPASEGRAGARRDLAGMSLMGPIADRPIVSYATPRYPEWAKREGVEGSVTLYFVVLADGRVKENIVVQKTAGFEDFDQNASTALRAWQFEPLRRGQTGEQWGTISIHFRLQDAG